MSGNSVRKDNVVPIWAHRHITDIFFPFSTFPRLPSVCFYRLLFHFSFSLIGLSRVSVCVFVFSHYGSVYSVCMLSLTGR